MQKSLAARGDKGERIEGEIGGESESRAGEGMRLFLEMFKMMTGLPGSNHSRRTGTRLDGARAPSQVTEGGPFSHTWIHDLPKLRTQQHTLNIQTAFTSQTTLTLINLPLEL